ncbi:hypothetical protein HK405_007451 [Cladochytrium tenue]|nr:hypothetical protein HK405_007451 [Cladochytrium tenue]
MSSTPSAEANAANEHVDHTARRQQPQPVHPGGYRWVRPRMERERRRARDAQELQQRLVSGFRRRPEALQTV